MSTLQPCPFCGATSISSGEVLGRNGPDYFKQNVCNGCGAAGPEATLSSLAIASSVEGDAAADEAWNRRAPVSGVRACAIDPAPFSTWAAGEGYDIAQTYDTERSRWVFLNPMTADLWKAWRASRGVPGTHKPVTGEQ
jgi:Lar family restriction alleviation protein